MSHTATSGTLPHTIAVTRLSDLDPRRTLDALAQHGALLIRCEEKPADVQAFEAFTCTVANEFQVHGNSARNMISQDGRTQEVDAGTHPLPAHAEVAYLPFCPDTMWFYCEVPPDSGGETTLCDGIALLDRLSPSTRQFFREHRIKYSHQYPKAAWSRVLPVPNAAYASKLLDQMLPRFAGRGEFTYHFDDQEVMHASFVTSAISRTRAGAETFTNSLEVSFIPRVVELRGGSATMEDGSPVPEEALRDVAAASAAGENPVRWIQGDIVMIDNFRVMHGRKGIIDPGHRRIFVRLGNRNN